MSIDTRLTVDMKNLMTAIDAPAPQIDAINRKMLGSNPDVVRPRTRRPLALAAAAAVTIAVLVLPQVSPALVQSLEMRYREALSALGGNAPPAPPQWIRDRLTVSESDATLASAQSRVQFTLTAPSGLPKDVVSSSIETAPVGIYSRERKSWQVGGAEVRFIYRRADGKSFMLLASQYDPALLPSRYLFEAKDPDASGKPVLIKHERFAWRNGDQLLTAQTGGASATEIAAIRAAMHGEPVALRAHVPNEHGSGTVRLLQKP